MYSQQQPHRHSQHPPSSSSPAASADEQPPPSYQQHHQHQQSNVRTPSSAQASPGSSSNEDEDASSGSGYSSSGSSAGGGSSSSRRRQRRNSGGGGAPHRRTKSTGSPSSTDDSATSPQVTAAAATATAATQYNVDYFSHDWDELDLKTSWSLMTKQKRSIVDGIRLENASWRKWIQKKYRLKTIRPELLKWKKDEDITWLYGPFCPSTTAEVDWQDAQRRPSLLQQQQQQQQRPRSSTSQALFLSQVRTGGVSATAVAASQNTTGDTVETTSPSTSATKSLMKPSSPPYIFPLVDSLTSPTNAISTNSTAKRSALKKAHQTMIQDFKKFQQTINTRISTRFPHLTIENLEHGAQPSTQSSPPLPIPSGKIGQSPKDMVPGMHVVRACRSDTALVRMHERHFLNAQEQALLRRMDHGPGIPDATGSSPPVEQKPSLPPGVQVAPVTSSSSNPESSPDQQHTLRKKPSVGFAVDAASPASTNDQPPPNSARRNKLRFSSEIEVVEFDTDARVASHYASPPNRRVVSTQQPPMSTAPVMQQAPRSTVSSHTDSSDDDQPPFFKLPDANQTSPPVTTRPAVARPSTTPPQRPTATSAQQEPPLTIGSLAKALWDAVSWTATSIVGGNNSSDDESSSPPRNPPRSSRS